LNEWFYIALTLLVLLIISNGWFLYRVVRPLQRLTEQTADVTKGNLSAFQQSCGGIPEIRMLRHSMASMAGHVSRAHDEGIAYRHALTDGQEAERARIAHELHDDTVQSLVAIGQSIDLATNWIERNPTQATTMLRTARTQAVETVINLRRLIANLRPPALEELGLIPALRMLAENEKAVTVNISVLGTERRLRESRELALFRAVQEAIHNVQRHGNSHRANVTVKFEADTIHLTVQDDGVGFLAPVSLDCLAKEGHYGLIGIQERVQQLKGTFHISSQKGIGTTVDVTLPLETADQPSQTVVDPVCGAVIQPQQAYGSVEYEGQHYYFCCPVCQGAFRRDPQVYLTRQPIPN